MYPVGIPRRVVITCQMGTTEIVSATDVGVEKQAEVSTRNDLLRPSSSVECTVPL